MPAIYFDGIWVQVSMQIVHAISQVHMFAWNVLLFDVLFDVDKEFQIQVFW